jgi:hypothetical protein
MLGACQDQLLRGVSGSSSISALNLTAASLTIVHVLLLPSLSSGLECATRDDPHFLVGICDFRYGYAQVTLRTSHAGKGKEEVH